MKIGKSVLGLTWGNILFSQNKSFEYQLEFGDKLAKDIFELSFDWTTKRDHAGIDFTFSIYKLFWLNLNIHDSRHWNYKENRWNKENEYDAIDSE